MYMQALLGPATFGLQIPLVHVTEDVIAEIVNLALKLLDLKSVSSSYSNSINFIKPKKETAGHLCFQCPVAQIDFLNTVPCKTFLSH